MIYEDFPIISGQCNTSLCLASENAILGGRRRKKVGNLMGDGMPRIRGGRVCTRVTYCQLRNMIYDIRSTGRCRYAIAAEIYPTRQIDITIQLSCMYICTYILHLVISERYICYIGQTMSNFFALVVLISNTTNFIFNPSILGP